MKNGYALDYVQWDAAWLSGAKAGMNELNGLKKDWRWEEFFNEIQELIEYSHVKPAKPGEEPFINENQKGSALDALGGYVSIAGDVTPEGLLLKELAPRVSVADVQAVTEPTLVVSPYLKEMELGV